MEIGWIQSLAFLMSIAYVILAARENIWCWFFGLIAVTLSFVVYYQNKLFSDATLQVFYMAVSVYGWYSWGKGREKQAALKISTLTIYKHLWLLLLGIAGTILLGYWWTFWNAALPFIDAFTTSFSIIATFLVARKILENWIYWLVIDTVCIYVYINRQIPLFALLFFVYDILAVYGLLIWYRQMEKQSS